MDLRRTSLSEQIFGYLLSIRKPERLVLRSEYNLISEKKTNQLIACSAHHGKSGIKLDTSRGFWMPSKLREVLLGWVAICDPTRSDEEGSEDPR